VKTASAAVQHFSNQRFARSSDCYQSQFDLKLLKEVQFPAEKISEISDLIIGKGLPNFPIVFCKLVGAAGCVYLEGEIPWPLIFIDISKIKDSNRFREVFIHEAAHLSFLQNVDLKNAAPPHSRFSRDFLATAGANRPRY
jgi:hypothetical protein